MIKTSHAGTRIVFCVVDLSGHKDERSIPALSCPIMNCVPHVSGVWLAEKEGEANKLKPPSSNSFSKLSVLSFTLPVRITYP